MPRIVIEQEGAVAAGEAQEQAQRRIDADVEWVKRRVAELAKARPPYLVEHELTLAADDPAEDGSRRYRVRAVLNTDKGRRLK